MTQYHDQLLAQAKALISTDARRPKQANLRRAVSAAYYALFHLLAAEATSRLMSGIRDKALEPILRRGFEHTSMKSVANILIDGQRLPFEKPRGKISTKGKTTSTVTVPSDLVTVAKHFKNLQEARHEADYNVAARSFTKSEVTEIVGKAENAFQAWNRVRKTKEADHFLVALLLHKQLAKRT